MKVSEILKRVFTERRLRALFAMLTPSLASELSPPARLILAGGTLTVLATAVSAAATATAMMLLAVGVIYYMLTQVLGVKLEFDPQMFMQQARRYESTPSAPN